MLIEDKCIIIKDDVESREIDDELIILNPEYETFFSLNKTGTEIWKSADGKTKIKIIAERLSKKFDADKNKILKDVIELVKRMESKKLIKLI